jgi:hypothetical protein
MVHQWLRATLSLMICVGFVCLTGVADAKSKTTKPKTATSKTTKPRTATSKGMTEPQKAACRMMLGIKADGDVPQSSVTLPPQGKCTSTSLNGFPIPDAHCTPGATNPTLTLDVLKNPAFKTGCVRDEATKAPAKAGTYAWYGINHPSNNTGANQVCELDHLISLEIGGADTLDNIWPQCGPSNAVLQNRFFKKNDTVENYLAWLVKFQKMPLDSAQRCIAHDWTQFFTVAQQHCPGGVCPKTAPDFAVGFCSP